MIMNKKNIKIDRQVEYDKQTRRRRILMKQKCNYIDNEISLNIQKLDTLLNIIKKKREQQTKLVKIIEVGCDEQNQYINQKTQKQHIQSEIQQNSKKQTRRLKFKYSIDREYEFKQFYEKQTTQQVIQTKWKQYNELSTDITNIDDLTKQNNCVNDNQQQLLLDGFHFYDNFLPQAHLLNNQQNGKSNIQNKLTQQQQKTFINKSSNNKLRKLKSISQSQYQENSPIQQIEIQTRYNWIEKYLNHQLNDTTIKALTQDNQEIQLIKFNHHHDHFQCKYLNDYELFNQLNLKSSPIQDLTNSILFNNSKISNHKTQSINNKTNLLTSTQQTTNPSPYFNYDYQSFIQNNPSIKIQFPKHTSQIQLIHPHKQQVVQLTLLQKNTHLRFILKNFNINPKNMQRIIIFQQILTNSNPQNDFSNTSKYKIVWTKYDKNNFTEDIILQGGFNYLIANICCSPSSTVKLLFNPVDKESFNIKKTDYDPWRSYNILSSAFQQCNKVFMSQNTFDNHKPLQYLRANYLDYGLVLETYQNIHSQNVAFLDVRETINSNQEDIELLFKDIYNQKQSKNIYQPGQLVIKFYQVTEKPAKLFFPQKNIIIGNQISQNVTIHATFK